VRSLRELAGAEAPESFFFLQGPEGPCSLQGLKPRNLWLACSAWLKPGPDTRLRSELGTTQVVPFQNLISVAPTGLGSFLCSPLPGLPLRCARACPGLISCAPYGSFPGLKPQIIWLPFAARLKSCPVTKLDTCSPLRFSFSQVSKSRSFDFAQDRLWGTPCLANALKLIPDP
jgi:hypothetical protein